MAKDATIELVENVQKHPNADKLDICNILGFKCVTKRDQFKDGDRVVYVRPDTVFPLADWTTEYRKYSPKRIKAIRLRGEWSEGVIMPFDALPKELMEQVINAQVGNEISEIIGITHYEPPAPQDLSAKGGLPLGIPKTDEERFENLRYLPYGEVVDVQSCSYYYNFETKEFGVLGRSLEIKPETTNRYTENVALYDIENKMRAYGEKEKLSFALRGESYGSGLQGHEHNPHAKMNKGWAVFSVYLINEHAYANKGHRYYFKNVAEEIGLPIAPMIQENIELTPELVQRYSIGISELVYASLTDSDSSVILTTKGRPFEGVVIKTAVDSFKIINKNYDSLK